MVLCLFFSSSSSSCSLYIQVNIPTRVLLIGFQFTTFIYVYLQHWLLLLTETHLSQDLPKLSITYSRSYSSKEKKNKLLLFPALHFVAIWRAYNKWCGKLVKGSTIQTASHTKPEKMITCTDKISLAIFKSRYGIFTVDCWKYFAKFLNLGLRAFSLHTWMTLIGTDRTSHSPPYHPSNQLYSGYIGCQDGGAGGEDSRRQATASRRKSSSEFGVSTIPLLQIPFQVIPFHSNHSPLFLINDQLSIRGRIWTLLAVHGAICTCSQWSLPPCGPLD